MSTRFEHRMHDLRVNQPLLDQPRTQTVIELGGNAIIIACLTYLESVLGLLIGVLVAVSWFALGVPYAIAIGHVLFAGFVTGPISIERLLVIEVGFLVLIMAALIESSRTYSSVGIAILIGGMSAGLGWYGWAIHHPVVGISLVLLTLTCAGYLVHRLSLLTTGQLREVRNDE